MSRYVSILAAAAAVAALGAPAAFADETGASATAFEQNWGMAYGDENRVYDAGTRDGSGNRVVINGRIVNNGGSTLSGGLQDDSTFGQWLGFAQATGNQLNVVTNGNFNTVIVDSTQINNGAITAEVRQGE